MLFRQGMMVLDDGSQALAQNMGVDLGGRDVGVTEHLLHTSKIRPVVQKVGRERVPKDMGRDLGRIDPAFQGEFLEQLAQPTPGQMALRRSAGKKES
jgi:hypothetical protein